MDDQTQLVEARRRRSRAEAGQLVAEYEASGRSQVEFCREQGLSLAMLARYRKRQTHSYERGPVVPGHTVNSVNKQVAGRQEGKVRAERADGRQESGTVGVKAANPSVFGMGQYEVKEKCELRIRLQRGLEQTTAVAVLVRLCEIRTSPGVGAILRGH